MKKTVITAISTLLMLSAFYACDNNDDDKSAKPTITYLSPEKDAHYHLGDNLEVASTIKSEAGIREIKIDIHYGEGHSHDENGEGHEDHDHDDIVDGNAWTESTIITEAENKMEYNLTKNYTIPADAAVGHYHVGILVTDKENQEVKEYRTIEIAKD